VNQPGPLPDALSGTPSDGASPARDDVSASAQPAAPRWLSTGDMARLSNNTLRTVRFYEEEGILRPLQRSEGGHRLFEPKELERLLLVTDLRAAGLSLGEIKQLLELKQHASSGADAAHKVTLVLAERVRELELRIAALARLRDDLARTAGIVAEACGACTDGTRFPDECATCSTMTTQGSLPRGLRVLWSVGDEAADAPPDAAAHPSDKVPR
jgi:DNA-binding transcriptional MerR regulator